jgi:hypothetical protein
MGTSSGFFSMGYGSPAAARHMSISFSRRNPLFTSTSRSSAFVLDFLHSLFGLGRGGDVGGVYPWADPSASLRDLFFPAPAPAFAPLDGEGFILQVHGVFTRIRSGASLVASRGSARGFANYSVAIEARVGGWLDLLQQLLLRGMKNPKGFSLYL